MNKESHAEEASTSTVEEVNENLIIKPLWLK